jgi:hypothetical protein
VRLYRAGTRELMGTGLVDTGGGYASQNIAPVHFGLGEYEGRVDVEITFLTRAGRQVTRVQDVDPRSLAGRPLIVREGAHQTTGQEGSVPPVEEARAALRQPSRESVARAISLAEQVVKSDPRNAAAYLVLARAHAASQRYLDVQREVALSRAWESLSHARALAPTNIEGMHLLADQIVARNHDYTSAKTLLETALKLDPQNAMSNHYYSQLLSGMGRFDEAFEYADRASALADADSRDVIAVNAGRLPHRGGLRGAGRKGSGLSVAEGTCPGRSHRSPQGRPGTFPRAQGEPSPSSPLATAVRSRWARLSARVHEVSPLACPDCGRIPMRGGAPPRRTTCSECRRHRSARQRSTLPQDGALVARAGATRTKL